jgi:hypothetical protein
MHTVPIAAAIYYSLGYSVARGHSGTVAGQLRLPGVVRWLPCLTMTL